MKNQAQITTSLPKSYPLTIKGFVKLYMYIFQLAADPDQNVKNGTELLDRLIKVCYIPYLFSYKTDFFSLQSKPKNLDLSPKTDLV